MERLAGIELKRNDSSRIVRMFRQMRWWIGAAWRSRTVKNGVKLAVPPLAHNWHSEYCLTDPAPYGTYADEHGEVAPPTMKRPLAWYESTSDLYR